MHLKKMKNGKWIGRCNSGKSCYFAEGDTLQDCQDRMFQMMMKGEIDCRVQSITEKGKFIIELEEVQI